MDQKCESCGAVGKTLSPYFDENGHTVMWCGECGYDADLMSRTDDDDWDDDETED